MSIHLKNQILGVSENTVFREQAYRIRYLHERNLSHQPDAEVSLREQLRRCELRSREFNGYGFFTNLAVPEDAPRCLTLDRTLHASAMVNNQSCGFILWLTDGRLDFLEGYPLGGDSWPDHASFSAITLHQPS
jgi:hypothetical protein